VGNLAGRTNKNYSIHSGFLDATVRPMSQPILRNEGQPTEVAILRRVNLRRKFAPRWKMEGRENS
jgi:hypothetical protein